MPTTRSTVRNSPLDRALRAYPSTAKNRRRSRLIVGDDWVEFAFSFNKSIDDHVDALLVDFIADRVNAHKCDPSDGRPASVCYRCNEEQANQFGRSLRYASTLPMADPPPSTTLTKTPLSVLLTHALTAFEREYEDTSSKNGIPSLPVLQNVLRVIDTQGMNQKEFEQEAILSSRTSRVVLRHCTDLGWLKLKKAKVVARSPYVLTEAGASMRKRGNRRVKQVETKWQQRFGKTYESVLACLHKMVPKFELEYPNYISGYGPADEALTGGAYLPAEAGPPRIPGRGEEWPVVERRPFTTKKTPSLPVLLSHTLTEFALDYEAKDLGRLGLTSMFFQHLPDEGLSLKDARKLQAITGNGKSLHERHLSIVIEPGKPSDGSRIVYPTQKARRSRDAYAKQLDIIESSWQKRFGRATVNELRRALEKLDQTFDDNLPDYPNTTRWMGPWSQPYLVAPTQRTS